jgi:MerR family transcriptional regulator, heat shock protein HspR
MIYVFTNTAMEKTANDAPVFSIGTVARMLDVSVEVIRLYERKGLILASRSNGQQRLYSESDVERLRCIRKAINEHKISIEGIRRIHSMIPCWEHIHCTPQERDNCPAYHLSLAGCWTHRHEQNVCAARDCRTCKVYQLSANCDKVKELIQHREVVAYFSSQTQQEGSAQ